MKYVLLFMVTLVSTAQASDNASWSKPANGLRARLLVLPSEKPESPFCRVYIEFQNVSDVSNPMKIRFPQDKFTLAVTDKSGKDLAVAKNRPYDGGSPIGQPLLLPYDGTLKFRISFPGLGYKPGEIIIDVGPSKAWIIPQNGSSYYLSGTLSIKKEKDDHPFLDWSGTLDLPKVEIPKENVRSVREPPKTGRSQSESPSQRGERLAREQLAKGTTQILYYGKPWSQGKPLVDDESGLPVSIVKGCCVTKDFVEETDAYNHVMREAAKAKREAASITAAGAKAPTPPADQEGRIAVEIARLGGSSKSQCVAAVKALVKIGKPAAPALVKVLSDPRNDVRAFAAEDLRSILAAEPAGAPNYHEKTYWQQRIARLKAGMTLDEALKLLLPDLSPAERLKTCEGSQCSGGSGTEPYRLDDYWIVHLYFLVDFERKKLHEHAPDLFRSVRQVWVAPPAGYTGTWVTWYVNGQKANEIQYRDGQYDGTFTAFYDDGPKCFQQHYAMGICHGTDTGWQRSGKKSYEGQYEHDKQDGTWRFFDENGQIKSSQEYEAGKTGREGG